MALTATVVTVDGSSVLNRRGFGLHRRTMASRGVVLSPLIRAVLFCMTRSVAPWTWFPSRYYRLRAVLRRNPARYAGRMYVQKIISTLTVDISRKFGYNKWNHLRSLITFLQCPGFPQLKQSSCEQSLRLWPVIPQLKHGWAFWKNLVIHHVL